MPVKLSDVKGLMVNKKREYKPTDEQIGNGAYYDLEVIEGFNSAIDIIGSRKIGMNREKLARFIYYADHQASMCVPFKELEVRDMYYSKADFIISKEAEILEFKGEK